jgi:Protein of unknown function (DUF2637)
VTGQADRWICRTAIRCMGMLALTTETVSFPHIHLLVKVHGQSGWVAALTPLSVDGMIVSASTTLLADSRGRGRAASRRGRCSQSTRWPSAATDPRSHQRLARTPSVQQNEKANRAG